MAVKQYHEIRDPIHNFIEMDSDERQVLDSEPVQRLRHIHQLAMSYLVYPGATHRRFEHSLGVMDLAGKVFDVVTKDQNIHSRVREIVPEIAAPDDEKSYWCKTLRMAALCHDVGHLPFSHAAEKDLLPDGWDHEHITAKLIQGTELRGIWESMKPPPSPDDVAKIAVGPDKMPDVDFPKWEVMLSEIISGEAFGVDRMDYLLRDSHHAGVAYGKFDHHRLVDTMRILPANDKADEPALGIDRGGIHTAEALLNARYSMFMQVYHHPVRMAYDFHLKQFLQSWLPNGRFSTDTNEHQKLTDNEVIAGILEAYRDKSAPGHEAAVRIVRRKHFQVVYTLTYGDKHNYENSLEVIYAALKEKYGEENVRKHEHPQRKPNADFPVLNPEIGVESSLVTSDVLNKLPIVDVGAILVSPETREDASKWLRSNRESILSPTRKESEHGDDAAGGA